MKNSTMISKKLHINNSTPKIKVHNRFLYRGESSFEKDSMHCCDIFGKVTVLAGEPHNCGLKGGFLSFDEGILALEYGKIFDNKISFPRFEYPKLKSHKGLAVFDHDPDEKFFAERGIYIRGRVLYFSPEHSKHDIRRLASALDEYFSS